MAAKSPVVSRRWLAGELRRLRRQRGLSQKEAGQNCGWSGARLSYLETGQQNVVEDDLDKLLDFYEVAKDERPRYYEAAKDSRARGWWEAYADVVPEVLVPYLGLEQGARQIRTFQPMVVPGLLQTPEYAANLFRHNPPRKTSRSVDRLVELRLGRQDVVTRSGAGLTAVIDEGVLHRAPRGDHDVLVGQIQHLIQMAAKPAIDVHVLPFEESIPDIAHGSFVVLTLDLLGPDPDVVYIETIRGGEYLEGINDVESYMLIFDGLVELARSSDESLAMMQEILERQTTGE